MNGEKTITREEYDAAVSKYHPDAPISSAMAVWHVLALCGITIEPALILPGVTPYEWGFIENASGSEVRVASTDGVVLYTRAYSVADRSEHLANAKVMAGSKKLVELVVADLRGDSVRRSYATCNTLAVIDQLETMGATVSEFKDGD